MWSQAAIRSRVAGSWHNTSAMSLASSMGPEAGTRVPFGSTTMPDSVTKGKRARSVVFRGNKEKTPGGLKKSDLMKSKTGKVVSKKAHANGKKAYAHIKGWTTAVQKARKALGVKGFQAVKKGSPLYKKAKELYGQ